MRGSLSVVLCQSCGSLCSPLAGCHSVRVVGGGVLAVQIAGMVNSFLYYSTHTLGVGKKKIGTM